MKKLSKILSLITSLAISATIFSVPAYAAKGNLIWSDEFDGNALNTDNWVYDVGYGYWGNSELEYYRSGTNNIKVEDGCLAITAKKESYGGASYTSGRITTCNKQLFQYGTIEARIKMPVGQGLWPAFWMLGKTTSWPNGGEIDIMEHINSETTVYGTGHDWNGGNTVSKGGSLNDIDVTQFHVYRIDWTEESITWFVDDKEYFTLDISEDNGYFPNTQVFHEPYYLLLNLAVGGTWPGDPVDSSFPSTMYVDYVRVYDQPSAQETPLYYIYKMESTLSYSSYAGAGNLDLPCVYDHHKAYMPFRITAYATGCPTVDYNEADNTIKLVNAYGIEYKLTIGSSAITTTFPDGTVESGDMGEAPILINGKTYLPVRATAALAYTYIEYVEKDSNAYIILSKDGGITDYSSWISAAEEAFGN